MSIQWNPEQYATNAGFVPALGHAALALLGVGSHDHVLDLGCGDGALTSDIVATGATVLGVDSSPAMLEAARKRGLDVRQEDAQNLPFDGVFTAVFSNAALHWMPDQRAVASGVFRALQPGGRYAGECGGFGNIAAIRTALHCTLARHGFNAAAASVQVYQTVDEFRRIHEEAGFINVEPVLIPRPTPLPLGMNSWLATFRSGLLGAAGVPAGQQEAILNDVEQLLRPVLCDAAGNWTADYVRLRWRAEKPR